MLVRVYAGQPDASIALGQLTFAVELEITSGVLGIGELFDEAETMHRVELARAGTVHLKVYTAKAMPAVRFDDSDAEVPLSGPTDIAVVIDPEALPGN